MSDFARKHQTRVVRLGRDEHVDLKFRVLVPGRISMLASAEWKRWWTLDPVERKIELFRPGGSEPVVSKVDGGWGVQSLVRYEVSHQEAALEGEWTCRITNLEDGEAQFTCTVVYPDDRVPVKVHVLPCSELAQVLAPLLGKSRVMLTRGENASYIDFSPEVKQLGLARVEFTLPDYECKISRPWSDIPIREYLHEVRSSHVGLDFEDPSEEYPNGCIECIWHFEEHGKEIVGTFHFEVVDILLSVLLGLEVRDNAIAYSDLNVEADFSFEMSLSEAPPWLVNPLLGYRKRIKRAVEEQFRKVFESWQMRQAFSHLVMNWVSPHLGENARLFAVDIQGYDLEIHYYNENVR